MNRLFGFLASPTKPPIGNGESSNSPVSVADLVHTPSIPDTDGHITTPVSLVLYDHTSQDDYIITIQRGDVIYEDPLSKILLKRGLNLEYMDKVYLRHLTKPFADSNLVYEKLTDEVHHSLRVHLKKEQFYVVSDRVNPMIMATQEVASMSPLVKYNYDPMLDVIFPDLIDELFNQIIIYVNTEIPSLERFDAHQEARHYYEMIKERDPTISPFLTIVRNIAAQGYRIDLEMRTPKSKPTDKSWTVLGSTLEYLSRKDSHYPTISTCSAPIGSTFILRGSNRNTVKVLCTEHLQHPVAHRVHHVVAENEGIIDLVSRSMLPAIDVRLINGRGIHRLELWAENPYTKNKEKVGGFSTQSSINRKFLDPTKEYLKLGVNIDVFERYDCGEAKKITSFKLCDFGVPTVSLLLEENSEGALITW